MIRDKKVIELQSIYLSDRSDTNFYELYKEILQISRALLFIKAKKSGIFIDVDTLSEDAALRYMEMYLKDEKWFATNIVKRLDFDILYVLYNKKQRQHDLESIELDTTLEIYPPERIIEESLETVIEDFMEDSIYWRNILLDCYKSRSFKEFITKLSAYENRKFCEDHIERLKNLYKNTRRHCGEKKDFGGFLSKISYYDDASLIDDHTEKLKSLYGKKKGRKRKDTI